MFFLYLKKGDDWLGLEGRTIVKGNAVVNFCYAGWL